MGMMVWPTKIRLSDWRGECWIETGSPLDCSRPEHLAHREVDSLPLDGAGAGVLGQLGRQAEAGGVEGKGAGDDQ